MNAEPTNQTTEPISNNRRKGNIAKLPKGLRDKINSMMDDGIDYADIIQALGEEGKHLHPSNFTHWKNGGYQDYLRDQAWRERMTINSDRFLDMATSDDDASAATAGGLHAAVIQLCQLMDELFNPKTGEVDADNFMRATNSLARLSRSIIRMQQHRAAVAKEKASQPGSPEAREKARAEFLDSMDQLFGIKIRKANRTPYTNLDGQNRNNQEPPRTQPAPIIVTHPSSLSSAGGESRREEATHSSNQSESEAVHQTVETSNLKPETSNVPQWVPVEQRPWNWPEISVYAAMSVFPPDGWEPPKPETQPTNESQTTTE